MKTPKTDAKISRALALAIGWTEDDFMVGGPDLLVTICIGEDVNGYPVWDEFDYMDWRVAGPIATRYECHPEPTGTYVPTMWSSWCEDPNPAASGAQDTPQKAIALAVINAFNSK